ncbi:MAG: hypothetical protein BECKG1743D_GA0114223_102375 [Candidatus Kentron sp. G]|nr:MAG: hypothetical protein BECKG1743F_GA0114225_102974 [Candidatus Kentron sp. G]VFM99583.1 MAG: hypothetical protein BECKG1743E_GA0114224_102665 [Candidatus Kentron sp. G]VFN00953.1 MAG: hypothetical protein BECKG1743D_GA0114223_102375 [Candidatus Kentron sp. G]
MWRVLNSALLLLFLLMLLPMVVLKLFSPWAVMLFVGAESKAQTLIPIAAPVVVLAALFMFVNGSPICSMFGNNLFRRQRGRYLGATTLQLATGRGDIIAARLAGDGHEPPAKQDVPEGLDGGR